MQPIDFLRALALGLVVLVGTLLASVLMVAFYAYVINPGHSQDVYNAAALWIAPWASHVFGPLLFFWGNYRGAVRKPQRNAIAFACASIVGYVILDMASVPLFGTTFATVLTLTFFLSLGGKTVGALLGAWLGGRARSRP
ncbi:MAG: hypothetical protein IBJ03_18425 [Gemmatimonadaceae bacterium]|nr:hypothetical protein [Gemmatimonadaceae bacterium]